MVVCLLAHDSETRICGSATELCSTRMVNGICVSKLALTSFTLVSCRRDENVRICYCLSLAYTSFVEG